MALARPALKRLDDIGFVKLMGAGTGEGFTPVPDTSTVAVLTTWPDLATAQRQTTEASVFKRYLSRADEALVLHLGPTTSRGIWAGQQPFGSEGKPGPTVASGPVAALTRATIRPRALLRFWRRAPAISRRIGRDPNVLFKIGVGEIPWLHQVTFSIWPDTLTMDAFARRGGPHDAAIRAVRKEGWFSEELYARFRILAHSGTWRGRDPLATAVPAMAAE